MRVTCPENIFLDFIILIIFSEEYVIGLLVMYVVNIFFIFCFSLKHLTYVLIQGGGELRGLSPRVNYAD
jgi:hypothetical protein